MMCMAAAGRRLSPSVCPNASFHKSFQSVSGFQRPGYFPSDFTLTEIDLQINIFFYDLEVKFLPFCCQMLKVFELKEAGAEARLENTEADKPVITNHFGFESLA